MMTRSCYLLTACLLAGGASGCRSAEEDPQKPIAPAPALVSLPSTPPPQTALARSHADDGALSPSTDAQPADPPASVTPEGADATAAPPSQFQSALEPYGEWVWTAEYGWVWKPDDLRPGWRPYTDGYWAYGDPYGWTWVSDAPWGWACDHYGRWVFESDFGWTWVPGFEWAPCWVAWHYGDGFVGWAPLPPGAVWRAGIGFGFTDWDPWIPAHSWCFVREVDVVERPIGPHVLHPARNLTLLRITKNTTNLTIVNGRIVNRSVDVEPIEHALGRPIPRAEFHDFDSPERARQEKLRTDEVAIIRAARMTAPARGAADLVPPPAQAAAPARPQPAPLTGAQREALLRAQAQEQSALERYQTQQRADLDELQRRDQVQAPAGTPDALRERHAMELQSLREQQMRELQTLQRMHQLQQQGQMQRPRPQPATPRR